MVVVLEGTGLAEEPDLVAEPLCLDLLLVPRGSLGRSFVHGVLLVVVVSVFASELADALVYLVDGHSVGSAGVRLMHLLLEVLAFADWILIVMATVDSLGKGKTVRFGLVYFLTVALRPFYYPSVI